MSALTKMMTIGVTTFLLAACGASAATTGEETALVPAGNFRDFNGNGTKEPYEDSSLPIPERVADLITRMTLEQKIAVVSGVANFPSVLPPEIDKVPGAAGYTVALDNLGIPSIVLADGPAGLRILPNRNGTDETYYATAFPIETAVSSTWDVNMAQAVGEAVGNEVREYGIDILLAPGMNIHRDPRGGRNFEYYSEDPYLNGHMGAHLIKGVQSAGVGATPKHYVANNQETNRYVVDTIVSERALREIYLRGFQIAVENAGPWAIMSAYNQVNGTPASQDVSLMTTVLRDEWGFGGVVMTDWFAGMDDTVAQMKAGNELLMPGTKAGTAQLVEAFASGDLDESVLDRNLAYILGVVMRSPSYAGYEYSDKPNLQAHARVARMVAAEGTVLLKNDNDALPIQSDVKRIAAFGNSSYDFISGGTGSGDVNEAYTVSLGEALGSRDFVVDDELERVYREHLAAEESKRPAKKNFFEFQPPPPELQVAMALIEQKAVSADIALITIGRNSGEFQDRALEGDFYLTDSEKALIRNVSEAFHDEGKKVVVILNIGNVVETASWRDAPDAIVVPWQGGQEAGNAVVDVLVGAVNPSGRLPTTFPTSYDDVPSSKNFPGEATGEKYRILMVFEVQESHVDYEEGIYVGYRYYDTFAVDPAYEFGFGLSYTTFEYSGVTLSNERFADNVTATVTVTNSGKVAGKEVIQLYLSAPQGELDKPVHELKGFAKTSLLVPGASETVEFVLEAQDLASFHDGRSAWIAASGEYLVEIGSSSRNIRSTATFAIDKELVAEKVLVELSPEQDIVELRRGR